MSNVVVDGKSDITVCSIIGSVLSEANIKEIIKFAHKYKLVLLADEVYQHNVWIGKFYSFRKVHYEMGAPFNKSELVSFMSCSKGFMGE